MTASTGVKSYSTTAANNVQANTGINWDEGMSPAAVNNSARANMVDVRAAWNDKEWFAYCTGDMFTAATYVSSTSFKYSAIDLTAVYTVGRRVRAVGSSTGTIYGTITAVAFSTDTTVTVVWDSGSLSNETLTVSIGSATTGKPNSPLSTVVNRAALSSTTRSGITSTTGVMLGFGSTLALTPTFSGRFRISVAAFATCASGDTVSVLPYYGTGSAPTNGAALTGTNPTGGNINAVTTASVTVQNMSFTWEVSGLTLGTAYWFDLAVVLSTGNATNLSARQIVVQEIA